MKLKKMACRGCVHRRWNRYNDLEIDVSQLSEPRELSVAREMCAWMERIRGRRGEMNALFWVKVPKSYLGILPLLVHRDFSIHHATEAYVMMVMRRSTNAVVPLYGTHYARVECVVLEEGSGRVLMVKESNGPDSTFKLVTGSVDNNEYISRAAVREVAEEAGIQATFSGTLGLGNRLATRFGRDEILVGVILTARAGQTPRADVAETCGAAWVAPEDAMRMASPSAREWLIAATSNPLRLGVLPDYRGPPHAMEVFLPSPQKTVAM